MGVPPVIIHFHSIFPYKPSSYGSYGGTPISGPTPRPRPPPDAGGSGGSAASASASAAGAAVAAWDGRFSAHGDRLEPKKMWISPAGSGVYIFVASWKKGSEEPKKCGFAQQKMGRYCNHEQNGDLSSKRRFTRRELGLDKPRALSSKAASTRLDSS